ncbi:MAG: sulfatase-like hydrolase/transferase [Verrucomicrobia bacterium]|nr:sulfatase-like hydrolase/transferase [Verrucomicrobiota bacterium]
MKLFKHPQAFLFQGLVLGLALSAVASLVTAKPNIIVIFADDMGYGDMSNNGHPTIRTPHLDKMTAEGQKWTSFYSASPVCTPSRAALLTGRYAVRSGMESAVYGVLFPESTGGMPATEITLPEMLKKAGYATGMVGKWHLGHLPEFLPTRHGFDSWYGIPYSNDMNLDRPRVTELNGGQLGEWHTGVHWDDPKSEYWQVPLMEGETILEHAPDQTQLTKSYTEKAIDFIESHKKQPFFLYLAHSMPHVPLFRSEEYERISTAGLYGDVIEEIDGSVGQILASLRELGIAENTLVVFTSDNGPWLQFKTQGGIAGPLRGGKFDTYEGGMREPGIFWWPGTVQPAIIHDIGCTLDFMATFAALAGVTPPEAAVDSCDLTDTLLKGEGSPRKELFYYKSTHIEALRIGSHKVHFEPKSDSAEPVVTACFNLDHDPGENYDLRETNPSLLPQFVQRYQQHRATLEPVEDQLAKR